MDCLRLFTKEDVLDGDEKPVWGVGWGHRELHGCRMGPHHTARCLQTCCRCKARTRCTKKFSIQKFPKILVLRILCADKWGWWGRCGVAALCRFPFAPHLLDVPPPPDLKRFSEARIRASKLTTFVNFPLKDLDLREFASQSCSKRWGQGGRAPSSHVGATDPLPVPPDHAVYNLYAVSNHSGTTMGGHYTAYCKSPISSEWHSFNDSR